MKMLDKEDVISRLIGEYMRNNGIESSLARHDRDMPDFEKGILHGIGLALEAVRDMGEYEMDFKHHVQIAIENLLAKIPDTKVMLRQRKYLADG